MRDQETLIIPSRHWQSVQIWENNESLEKIEDTLRIRVGLIPKQYEISFLVRRTVHQKLQKVSERLPPGINLVVIEGYRTTQSQQLLWDNAFIAMKDWYPDLSDEEIESKVRLVIAKPTSLANHHCGGAVDVTLAYSDGTLLDMGTPYPEGPMSIDWYKKFQMLSDEITEEQKANRKILRDAMETEHFVWYPGEWWHYCWGDRMWAVYTDQRICLYGSVDEEYVSLL